MFILRQYLGLETLSIGMIRHPLNINVCCYGILACLRGLKEQGCDGPVTEALDKLEKHLNMAAHDQPERR